MVSRGRFTLRCVCIFFLIQAELGEMDNWQEDANAWENESDATWEAEEVLRYYKVLLL